MKRNDREQVQRDIAQAFGFIRFLVHKPEMLKEIKDGCEIRFLAGPVGGAAPRPMRLSRNVQAFRAETVFHQVSDRHRASASS